LRNWKFLAALGLIVVMVLLGAFDLQRLSYERHMVVHVVILLCAAPLTASLVVVPPTTKSTIVPLFGVVALVIPAYHLTPLGGYVMESGQAYGLELIVFFMLGIYLWLPIYGRGEIFAPLAKLAYISLATSSILITGLVLRSSTTSPATMMSMAGKQVDIVDVHVGGTTMVLMGLVLLSGHALIASSQALRQRHSALFAAR
jgi:hypothetical protein